MEEPWYIRIYEDNDHIHKKELQFKNIDFKVGDHRHCEVCWDKFSYSTDCLHRGYYEKESKCWVCEKCFKEFRNLYGWTVCEDNDMGKPWDIRVYENSEHLHKKKLQFKKIDFKPNEHRYCNFCWDKLADMPDCLHEGYYEKDSDKWICEKCFTLFSSLYEWQTSDD